MQGGLQPTNQLAGEVMARLPVHLIVALGAAACVLIAVAVWAIRRWRLGTIPG